MYHNILKTSLVATGKIKNLIILNQINSTNQYAKSNKLESDCLVITGYQTGGRGRFNRQWLSSKDDDVTVTIVKDLKIRIDEIQRVNFYVSYILAETILNLFPSTGKMLSLKWPNDIILNGKKVCGILTEVSNLKAAEKKFIIGIGLNLNRKSFHQSIKAKATSLLLETGIEIGREDFIIKLIENFYNELDLLYKEEDLIKCWKQHSKMIGVEVCFRLHDDSVVNNGFVEDVQNDGALVMRMDGGVKKKFYSGEISMDYESFA